MKILALDDEAGALKLLVRAIKDAAPEAELLSFMNAKEALKAAETMPPDVAFLDIMMPEISGLEAAKRLKKINPGVNVIFTTGFSEYAVEAMKLRSSGYLLKPVMKADVKTELANLRNPVDDGGTGVGIEIRTFGFFDVFVNGQILDFRMKKAKEVLAYLVDRQGGSVSRKELAAVVFEDREYTRSVQTYLSQIMSYLNRILDENGASGFLMNEYNTYFVNVSKCRCDAYDYMKGDPEAINRFHGEYMSQYSWGEEQLYRFYQ